MNIIIIEKFLTDFRCCFQHTVTFNWFLLVIILGFIVRSDHLGVSSFVRCFYFQSKASDKSTSIYIFIFLIPSVTQTLSLL